MRPLTARPHPSHRRGFTHQMIDLSLSIILARLNVQRNEGHSHPDRRRRDNSVTCGRRMVLPNNLLFANLAALNAWASAATPATAFSACGMRIPREVLSFSLDGAWPS